MRAIHDLLGAIRVRPSDDRAPLLLNGEDQLARCNAYRISLARHLRNATVRRRVSNARSGSVCPIQLLMRSRTASKPPPAPQKLLQSPLALISTESPANVNSMLQLLIGSEEEYP